jgi:hypothetical protein
MAPSADMNDCQIRCPRDVDCAGADGDDGEPMSALCVAEPIILFAPLTPTDLRRIAADYLLELEHTLDKAGKTIDIDEAALDLIASRSRRTTAPRHRHGGAMRLDGRRALH